MNDDGRRYPPMDPHYAAALDEIYRLRTALAYEAEVISAHLSLATFPKSRRPAALEQIQRMRRAARGHIHDAYRSIPGRSLNYVRRVAGMGLLTRTQWETDQGRTDPSGLPVSIRGSGRARLRPLRDRAHRIEDRT